MLAWLKQLGGRFSKTTDKIIGSGHPFGFSVRLIIFATGVVSAVVGFLYKYSYSKYLYLFACLQQMANIVSQFYDWLDAHGTALLIITTCIGFLFLIWYMRLYYRTTRNNREARSRLGMYEANCEEFLVMAQENARCDQRLFDLFISSLTRSDAPREAIQDALSTIEGNIDSIIEQAVTLFDRLTGTKCAVCLKLLDYDSADSDNLYIRTRKRDRYSYSRREMYDDKRYPVRSSTAYRHLFTVENGFYPNTVYAEDDLLKAYDSHTYDNERLKWKEDYTATIVCGIDNLHENRKVRWRGLLCVDNKRGGFKTPIAEQYIAELAYRISVMLYRQLLLGAWLQTGDIKSAGGIHAIKEGQHTDESDSRRRYGDTQGVRNPVADSSYRRRI